MSSENDKKILALREKIKEKKDKMQKVKFSPITNCSIEFEGERFNISVLNKEALTLMLIKLNAYRMSMNDLGIKEYFISGYSVQDWITDIKLKLDLIIQKKEENTLAELENKLNQLLTEDKKTELELNSIEDLLK